MTLDEADKITKALNWSRFGEEEFPYAFCSTMGHFFPGFTWEFDRADGYSVRKKDAGSDVE